MTEEELKRIIDTIHTVTGESIEKHVNGKINRLTKIVEDKGLVQISAPSMILPIIDEIIAKNPDNVEKFKAGNTKLLGFFVGQVLKATEGKANPQVVNELVAEKLK